MRSPAPEREGDDTLVWNVACPTRPSSVPGVAMAGFSDRGRLPEGQRLIPHPAVTLVLDFGPAPPVVDAADGRRHRGSLVAGLGLGGALWARGDDLACVQVRLSPVTAGAALGVRPDELEGAVVPLDALWGRDAARIGERLGEAASWEERFALTDALLARRCAAATPANAVDPEVNRAWDRLVASRGRARVERLADEVGWSRKRLWSRFRAQVGMGPKRAAKLVRFDHAAHRLAAGHDTARVAAEGGYTDQSHLHRDVVAFTGVTPTGVARASFLTVDETAWPTLPLGGVNAGKTV
ncbi:helix-turn-helix domain-containing protein [Streptomyces albiaxialis]|uniref:Helix-turn-helix domain-containing protein n=1 Tax=Streptomyces albiaxialis TaxID=329523 RepID=A0ABN2VP36_9ACTN